jgi:small-conductance mechanosensitive channel
MAVLARWARRTLTPVDDILVKALTAPVRLLFPLQALLSCLPWLVRHREPAFLKQMLGVSVVLTVAWIFFRAVRAFEEIVAQRAQLAGSLKARSQYTQVRGLGNVARFLIGLTTAGLVLLSFAGVRELGVSMLASAGVAGITIGFAAQRTISAVVSGLVIAVAQPVRLDDTVVVEGEQGVVEEIGLTYAVVRLSDGRCMVLPINYFLEKPFQNWSRSSTQVRTGVDLHLDYSAPLGLLREELRRILESSPHWDREHWDLGVSATNERGMVVKASMSADARKAADLRGEVREKLVTFVQQRCPGAFQRARTELIPVPPAPGSQPGGGEA